MATTQKVIQSAYRRSGLLAMGVNMNEEQAQVGLELLSGMYQNLLVGGMFGRAKDTVYDGLSPITVKPGQRIYNKNGAEVLLPDLVPDEDCGGDMQPRDGAFVTVVHPTDGTKQHIYDRSIGKWTEVSSLDLSAEAPLSGRFEDHIKNMLAVRLLGEAGQPTPIELTRAEARARLALASRRDGERETGVGVFS